MRRVLAAVASILPAFGRGGGTGVHLMILLLTLTFGGSVEGWQNGLSVPDTSCHTQSDCLYLGWTDPLPNCENSTCTCPLETCAVYTTGTGVYEYQYFCGPCGMLGSKCANNTDCKIDWRCINNFCQCAQGSVYHGVCWYSESVPTSVSSVILVLILMVIVAVQKIISSRKTLRKLFCHSSSSSSSSSESEDDVSRVVASNPQSNDKTAAFTVANTDFMATAEHIDLAWVFEHSRHLGDFYDPSASTWSSTSSTFPPPDPRFIRPRPAPQAGPSGRRQSPDGVRLQRQASMASLSSSMSSPYLRQSSGTISSYNSSYPSASFRNTSTRSSLTNSSRPPSLAYSDEVPLPRVGSLRMDFDENHFESTRV